MSLVRVALDVPIARLFDYRCDDPDAHIGMRAVAMGLFQFTGNYVFVYLAEQHLTSGIVALLVGLMLVPNAVLGWLLLGQQITRRFLIGSVIALATGIGKKDAPGTPR